MSSQEVDGSGRYAEAVMPNSPAQSQPSQYSTAMIDMMSSPIPVEEHSHGLPPSKDKKDHLGGMAYYSAPEVVEQGPPSYQYSGPPPGSPPPQMVQPNYHNKEQTMAHGEEVVPQKEERKILGMTKRRFFIILGIVAIVILAVALGAGLGIGIKNKDDNNNSDNGPAFEMDAFCQSSPDLCIGGSLNPEYYSKKGAFNGTGIALAGESWNGGQRRIFTLYFQHHSGDIRYMQYRADKTWDGGDKAQTVATDAKNGTALSAVAYLINGTQYFHLFYINKDNKMRQMTQSNDTQSSGFYEPNTKLNNLNLQAMDSPNVGMQACWKGDYYGDSDPTGNITLTKEVVKGINLFYASDDTTFEQYSWNNEDDKWTKENPWKGKNGHAGVGCYSWGTGTFSYTIMVNDQNNTEIWWIDTNSTTPSTKEHPINSWTNSTKGGVTGVWPTTSFGFTTYLYMQMADKTINAYDVKWEAENTTISDEVITIRNLGSPVPGLGSTHMSLTAYNETTKDENGEPTRSDWDSLYVFYQTDGDDLSAFTRRILGGEWTEGKLEIPDN